MKVAAIFLAGTALLLSACSSTPAEDNEPVQQATAAHVQPVHMSAIASGNCSSAGGTLAYARQLDGSRVGMCQLSNGKRCSEASMVSGTCAN